MLDRLVDIFISGIVQALTILLLVRLGIFPCLAIVTDLKELNDKNSNTD